MGPNVPANTVKEFIAYAKANPGKLSYGFADIDLIGGQIQFMTDTVNSVMPFVRDKRLKMLAVTTPKRMSLFPDVPTLVESGMPGFEVGAWQGLMVPANTPKPSIQRLNAEEMKALQSTDMRQKLAAQGAETLGLNPGSLC